MIYKKIITEYGNSLCFDIGANIGNRTKTFLDLGYSHIIAVEPQNDCFAILSDKFKSCPEVTIINKAVSHESGISKIYISTANTISSMDNEFIKKVKEERFQNYSWDTEEEITTTTLDILISEYGNPDFIKIDVEGFELNVLKGLSTPAKCISFEYTPELHHKSMACIDYLESISKDYLYNFSLGESLEFSFSKWVDKQEIDSWLQNNVLNKKDSNNNLLFGDIYAKHAIK
jgi:FkbM family methyltransferase